MEQAVYQCSAVTCFAEIEIDFFCSTPCRLECVWSAWQCRWHGIDMTDSHLRAHLDIAPSTPIRCPRPRPRHSTSCFFLFAVLQKPLCNFIKHAPVDIKRCDLFPTKVSPTPDVVTRSPLQRFMDAILAPPRPKELYDLATLLAELVPALPSSICSSGHLFSLVIF